MKAKLFILVFLTISTLLGASNLLNIDYSEVKLEDFKVDVYVDSTQKMDLDEVRRMPFHSSPNIFSKGFSKSIVWIRIEIKNSTKLSKNIFLHNNFAYYSKEISIYEFEDNKFYDQNLYTFEKAKKNKLTGSVLVYPIHLNANTKKIIYIKTEAFVTQLFNLNIYDEKNHFQAFIDKNIYTNFIITTLLILAFYNIFLFFFNKKKEFIYYSVYLLNGALGLSYMYGLLFQNLQYSGEIIHHFNITAILFPALLLLFVQSIFQFKKKNNYLYVQIKLLYIITAITVAFALFVDTQLAVNISTLIFLFSFIIIIQIAIILYQRKHLLRHIFIAAYSIYIFSFTITLLAIQNLFPFTLLSFYMSGIGLILEAILFSYLLHYHTKILEKKILTQESQIILKNQKTQMGEMIGAITHQWKQPLTTISSIIMIIQFKLENKNLELKELDKKITQIDTNIHFLSETIDDFRNFFSPHNVKTECNLDMLIQRAIKLSSDEVMANNIIIKKDLNFEDKPVVLFENELLHIILNIIQNAKEAFLDNKIDSNSKMIKIIGTREKDNVFISIVDNAGGVSPGQLPFIFQENYTTKDNGTGLGLYLSKVIIENHMGGSIEAKNIGDGTMFRIIL